jgi:hypothetical protein
MGLSLLRDPVGLFVLSVSACEGLINVSSVDAVINFPSGLVIEWNGAPLGTIAMPNITIGTFVG